jgi:hypothetical protein
MKLQCDLDCVYRVRFEKATTHSTKLAAHGRAEVGDLVEVDLGTRHLSPGTYRYTLRLVHPVNPASEPTLRQSLPFALP